MRFADRRDAGQRLADRLESYRGHEDLVVLALPRGGVPVAYEVAARLGAPLDLFLVRKLGVPGQEELAMGAIATGGVRVLNAEVLNALRLPEAVVNRVAALEGDELKRRERLYRGDRPPLPLRARTVILIDDGLATGSTMRAAVRALRQESPAQIVVAVPVGAPETCEDFRKEVEEVVCLFSPTPFLSVGLWYDDFSQTTDEEVRELLNAAEGAQRRAA